MNVYIEKKFCCIIYINQPTGAMRTFRLALRGYSVASLPRSKRFVLAFSVASLPRASCFVLAFSVASLHHASCFALLFSVAQLPWVSRSLLARFVCTRFTPSVHGNLKKKSVSIKLKCSETHRNAKTFFTPLIQQALCAQHENFQEKKVFLN